MPYLNTGQANLYYQIDGMAGAPWLILANSIATDLHLWDEAVPFLADNFSILRFDMRGHGKSAPPDGALRIRNLSSDIVALMDGLKIETAHLAGVSLGAMVILDVLHTHSDRVKTITFCNAITQANDIYKSFWAERISMVKSGGMSAIAEPTIERWFTQNAPQSLRDKAKSMILRTTEAGFCGAAEALRHLDLNNTLHGIQVPVHFVAGADDAAAPTAIMRAAAMSTPGSHFTVLSDTAHLSSLERPQALARVITITSSLA